MGKLVEVGQFRFNGGAVFRCKGFIAVFFGPPLGSFVEGFVFSSSSSSKVRAGSDSFSFAETV